MTIHLNSFKIINRLLLENKTYNINFANNIYITK